MPPIIVATTVATTNPAHHYHYHYQALCLYKAKGTNKNYISFSLFLSKQLTEIKKTSELFYLFLERHHTWNPTPELNHPNGQASGPEPLWENREGKPLELTALH